MNERSRQIDEADGQLDVGGLKNRMRRILRLRDADIDQADAVKKRGGDAVDVNVGVGEFSGGVFKIRPQTRFPIRGKSLGKPLRNADRAD